MPQAVARELLMEWVEQLKGVSSAVLSRNVIVNNAQFFAKTAAESCPYINVKLVVERDIHVFTQQHQLESLWENVASLVGKNFRACCVH